MNRSHDWSWEAIHPSGFLLQNNQVIKSGSLIAHIETIEFFYQYTGIRYIRYTGFRLIPVKPQKDMTWNQKYSHNLILVSQATGLKEMTVHGP